MVEKKSDICLAERIKFDWLKGYFHFGFKDGILLIERMVSALFERCYICGCVKKIVSRRLAGKMISGRSKYDV